MKKVQMFSIAMAVIMLVVTFVPLAANSASAQENASLSAIAPAQAFVDAARGLPLLAPMSIAAPLVMLSVEPVASSDYSCSLVKQSPGDWVKMQSRQSFDMVWTLQNTGAMWHSSSTKFVYVGGSKMQTKGDSFALANNVGRGGKIKLTVDMIAPKAKGLYSTLWALYAGNTRFCKVTLVLVVTR